MKLLKIMFYLKLKLIFFVRSQSESDSKKAVLYYRLSQFSTSQLFCQTHANGNI